MKKTNYKCCKNCIKGIPVKISNEILCREKGLVSCDFVCSGFMSFELDMLQRQLNYHCSDCAFFTFTTDACNDNFGVCSMFSVRECDGSLKKACSKFTRKKQHIA